MGTVPSKSGALATVMFRQGNAPHWPLSLGRNGYMHTCGVVLTPFGDFVDIMPVTSRGYPGRCAVSLPRDAAALRAVGEALLRLAEQC